MVVVFVIIGIVALVSLYDFASSKNWQLLTSETRNSVVFEKRNKAYGAYKIRKQYDRNLLWVLLGVLFVTSAVCVGYAGLNRYKPKVEDNIPESVYVETSVEIEFESKKKPEQKTVSNPDKSMAKTVAFIEPKVVEQPMTDTVKSQDELDKLKAASKELEGKGSLFTSQTNPQKEKEKGKEPEPTQPVSPTSPEKWVDVEASFPGGFKAMVEFIQKHLEYPDIAATMNIQGKCFIRFVVSEEGEISEVSILRGIPGCPECDKEASRVIKSMPKWIPGKIKNKSVSSYFNLPITFELE